MLLQKTKTTLADIEISPDFVPVFPIIIEPAELLKEINAQLGAMIAYADFQVEADNLRAIYPKPISAGDSEAIQKAFDELPIVPEPQEYLWRHTYGRYKADYNNLKRELGL